VNETLGLILIRSGVVTREDLYEALEVQRQTGRYLGSCMLALGMVTPEELRSALSQQLGVEIADGRSVLAAEEGLAAEIPVEAVERYRVVPFALEGETLLLAFYEPGTADSLSEIAFFTGRAVKALLCDEPVVERAIARLYPKLARAMTRLPQRSKPAAATALPPSAGTETAMAPVEERPQPPRDLRQPAELIRPVEEISNRDFAQALGLEEPAPPVGAPIPLVSRRRGAEVRDVAGSALLSIVEAAEQIFEARTVADIAEAAVRFLRSFFDRSIAFDLSRAPAPALVRSGFVGQIESLDISRLTTLAEVIRRGQSFHGCAPKGGDWMSFYSALGSCRPGSVLIAPVRDRDQQRLLFYADTERPEPYEDLHEAAVLVREVSTALSILEVS